MPLNRHNVCWPAWGELLFIFFFSFDCMYWKRHHLAPLLLFCWFVLVMCFVGATKADVTRRRVVVGGLFCLPSRRQHRLLWWGCCCVRLVVFVRCWHHGFFYVLIFPLFVLFFILRRQFSAAGQNCLAVFRSELWTLRCIAPRNCHGCSGFTSFYCLAAARPVAPQDQYK